MTHQTRPIIGIVASRYLRPSTTNTYFAGIGERYITAVEAAGGIPMLIHLTHDEDVRNALYERCDALLLAGGGDVDPMHFRAAPHPNLGAIDALRDEVELALIRRAVEEQKPVLGICRGHQMLNVALGGTLFQDIPAELPDALDHYASRNAPERSYLAHTITLEADSWLSEQLQATDLPVNTFHHQAVRDIARGLRVTGHAPDGVVEALEGTGAGFVVGVQCHPEELWDNAGPRWARMFAAFVDVARRSS